MDNLSGDADIRGMGWGYMTERNIGEEVDLKGERFHLILGL